LTILIQIHHDIVEGALSVGGLLLITGMGIGYNSMVAAIDLVAVMDAAKSVAASAADTAEILNNDIHHGEHELREALADIVEHVPEEPLQGTAKFCALGVSAIGIVVKEWLFQYTLKAGKASNSAAVVANAWQHRSDAAVAIAVFAGLAGSMYGLPLLDPLAALLVSGVIVRQVS